MVIGFSVFTYSCSYVQVAWIQRLMAITYWAMQKVRILSGFSHRCCQRKIWSLLSAEGTVQRRCCQRKVRHKRQKARYNG